ncbi:ABC transporter permease subunit [Escherichia coli]
MWLLVFLVCWCWVRRGYAIGAYTFALSQSLLRLGLLRCLPIAGLMAAAAGFLLGFPVLRLRGDYLAIVTLVASAKLCAYRCSNNTEITGGPNGYQSDPKTHFFGLEFSLTRS